ncbi:hypothetical protein [Nocardioides kribbensis]|uniref:Zinc ribbon domain-containing protein n=1 Tax=Nocardioides kribbensis TaxID=305517 RepID=A0ABV1NZJ7_9ACTN
MPETQAQPGAECATCGEELGASRYCLNCGTPRPGTVRPAAGTASTASTAGGSQADGHDVTGDGSAPDGEDPLVGEPPPLAASPTGAWGVVSVVVPLVVLLATAGLIVQRAVSGERGEALAAATETCWDGRVTDAGCELPTGVEGLEWVFPSFRPDEQTCRDFLLRNPQFNRPTMWQCDVVVDDLPVVVTYNELTGQRAALRFFDQRHGRENRTEVPGYDGQDAAWVWLDEAGDRRSSRTLMLQGYPYAVTVESGSTTAVEAAFEEVVEIRPVDELAVRPD